MLNLSQNKTGFQIENTDKLKVESKIFLAHKRKKRQKTSEKNSRVKNMILLCSRLGPPDRWQSELVEN